MFGMIKVDGKLYRYMGAAQRQAPRAAKQLSLAVFPTTTAYAFEAEGVRLELNFTTPALGLDEYIVRASRPITHVTFAASSVDGRAHSVELYFDQSADSSVSSGFEEVSWSRRMNSTLEAMQMGSKRQAIFSSASSDLTKDRINWGFALLATTRAPGQHTVLNSAGQCRGAFKDGSYFSLKDDTSEYRRAGLRSPLMSVVWDLGSVGSAAARRHVILAYDQILSIRYFGTDLAPLWRRRWVNASALLLDAEADRTHDLARSELFDQALLRNLTDAGGEQYASLASLVYRQVVGATQAVWNPIEREPWVFLKEISSDGDVNTVDVIYPAFPMLQYLYPEYARRTLLPILVYANNGTKPYGLDLPYGYVWAPHHLGVWPICDLAADKQEQQPMEESGNMLIMLAAIYQEQRSLGYLDTYWPLLKTWADFLVASLPDPGDQLCTDDFEGKSPHNANLAVKGIVALGAYAQLLRAKGDAADAEKYSQLAKGFVRDWMEMAEDEDHYKLQFNKADTWSQKYNLLYQRVLGLDLFPNELFATESAYYQTKLQECGVPLDSRWAFSKTDWSIWAASFAAEQQFQAVVKGLYQFAHTTKDRVPLSDWYGVRTCKTAVPSWLPIGVFRARPVQGGLFAKVLVWARQGGNRNIVV